MCQLIANRNTASKHNFPYYGSPQKIVYTLKQKLPSKNNVLDYGRLRKTCKIILIKNSPQRQIPLLQKLRTKKQQVEFIEHPRDCKCHGIPGCKPSVLNSQPVAIAMARKEKQWLSAHMDPQLLIKGQIMFLESNGFFLVIENCFVVGNCCSAV